jgi:NitT/TauT family transport system substrate-binding protein
MIPIIGVRHRRLEAMAALLLVPLLFLVASNGATAQAAPKGTFHLAFQRNIFMAPMFVALEKDWLQEAVAAKGYELVVDQRPAGTGGIISIALASGSVDVGQIGLGPAINAISRGASVKIVAGSGRAGEGFVVRNDSNIRSMNDLKGKRVSIPAKGSMQDYVLRKALAASGMQFSDVDVLIVGEADMKSALLTNQVDVVSGAEPAISNVVAAGARMIATGQEIWPDHANDVIVATSAAISEHADAVKATVETFKRAITFVQEHPSEAQEITAKATGVPIAVVRAAWPNVGWYVGARPDMSSIQELAKLMLQDGIISRPFNAQDGVDEQFTR